MRKVIALISLVILSLLLTACTESEESRTFELANDGLTVTVTYKSVDNTVTEYIGKNKLTYTKEGVANKEAAEELFTPVLLEYQDIKGLEHSIDFTDSEVIEIMEVDFTKVDSDIYNILPGMRLDKDSSLNINMKEIVKQLEADGFVEVK